MTDVFGNRGTAGCIQRIEVPIGSALRLLNQSCGRISVGDGKLKTCRQEHRSVVAKQWRLTAIRKTITNKQEASEPGTQCWESDIENLRVCASLYRD